MATKAKAKPKATKATAAKTTKKAPAKKASKAASKPAPKAPVSIIEDNTFAKFNGYRTEVAKDEVVFEQGETVFIIGSEESENGILYTAIAADEVGAFLDGGEDVIERGGEVASSELSELKGGALDKAREAFMPIAMVGRMDELLEAADGDAIDVAVQLNQDIQESYFYMGGALSMVLQSGAYLKDNGGAYDGEDAFNDFCQAEFGFKASKGRQLARIYNTFSALPDFDPESLRGIGWSIAGKLEKYVTEENVDDVIEAASAEGVTQRNVDALMQDKFVEADGKSASGRATSRGDKLSMTSMSFRLTEDSSETVRIALDQFKKQNGITDDNLALEGICVAWGQENIETKTAKQKLGAKARAAAKARESKAKPAAAPKPTKTKAVGKKKAA